MIEKFSPQRHLDKLVAPIIVAHGTLETPKFQRQNREFAAAVKAAGEACKIPGRPRLYAFRDVRDAGKSLRATGPRNAGANETERRLHCRFLKSIE